MNHIYNKSYYEESYQEEGGGSYANKKLWYPFFDQIAQKIAETYQPKTVLDAGCAYGYLVEAFRKRGIESYGIDISEYAISHVDKSIQAFCSAQSITEPLPKEFPKKFDLIISIEVLEHLTAEEGEQALKNLCNYTDTFIFSSTDSDIEDITHINVQRKEYWARIFAQNGFFRELQQSLDYISPQADMYCKRDDIGNIIQEYEIALRIAKSEEKKKYFSSYLYYDTGNGLNEKEKLILENSICEDKINFCIEIPNETKSIRLDPIEEKFCIITQLEVLLDDCYTYARPLNGIAYNDLWIFMNTDPQIDIELNGKNKLEVKGNIFLIENMGMTLILQKLNMMENERKNTISEMSFDIKSVLTEIEKKLGKLEKTKKNHGWKK